VGRGDRRPRPLVRLGSVAPLSMVRPITPWQGAPARRDQLGYASAYTVLPTARGSGAIAPLPFSDPEGPDPTMDCSCPSLGDTAVSASHPSGTFGPSTPNGSFGSWPYENSPFVSKSNSTELSRRLLQHNLPTTDIPACSGLGRWSNLASTRTVKVFQRRGFLAAWLDRPSEEIEEMPPGHSQSLTSRARRLSDTQSR